MFQSQPPDSPAEILSSHLAPDPRPDSERIVRLELWPIFVPFRPAVREAMQTSPNGLGMALRATEAWTGGDGVICRLTTAGGVSGLGEAFIWMPETGASPQMLIDLIRGSLARYVLNANPFDIEAIRRNMDENVMHCEAAKGILDMACYDLMGRLSSRSTGDLIGGRAVAAIPAAMVIPLAPTPLILQICEQAYAQGFRTFRLKLGEGLARDVEIVSAVRAAYPDVDLRVDYNQAYRPPEAIRAIRAIEPYRITCAEQPVDAINPLAMQQVQRAVDTPLMAHEGCFGLTDLITLIELGAVKILGLNAERPGGVTSMLRAITYAEMRGLGVVMHNQPFGISTAMQAHIAAARFPALGHAVELCGDIMLEDDLVLEGVKIENGWIHPPTGPGWGVELDEAAVELYAIGPRVVLVPDTSQKAARKMTGAAPDLNMRGDASEPSGSHI